MLRSAIAKSRPLSSFASSLLSRASSSLSRPYSHSTARPAFKCGSRPRRADRFAPVSSLARSQHSSASSSSESRSSSDVSSSSSSSSPQQWHRDLYDPFASFDLLRRQVDRMFTEFDRQMFGGLSSHPFFLDDPFESIEGGSGRSNQHRQLNGNERSGGQTQAQGQGQSHLKEGSRAESQEEDHSPTVLEAVDGSNDVGEKSSSAMAPTMATNQHPLTRSPSRTSLFGWPFDHSSSSLSPLPRIKMDLIEEKDQYVLNADVPGFNRDDLKLSIQDGMLMLSGETKQEKERKDEEKKYHRIERSSGKIVRTIRLPMDVKEDEIRASCEHGVLKIVIPKDEAAKIRKQEKSIQIQ